MDALLSSIRSFSPDLLKDVILALIAALLAVRISIRQFSSQRWWERQEESYSRVIVTLSEMLSLLGRLNSELTSPIAIQEEEKKRLWSKLLQRINELEKVAHEGAFRISKTSVEALWKLLSDLYPVQPQGDPWDNLEQYSRLYRAVTECRNIVDSQARSDLKLPRYRSFKKYYSSWKVLFQRKQ